MLFGASNKNLGEEIFSFLEEGMELLFSPLDLLTFGIVTKYRLTPRLKSFLKKREELENHIIQEVRKMEQLKEVQSNTFLGGMINYNRQNPESKISDEDIVGNTLLFVFAGYDTSRNSTGFGLHFLGKDPQAQLDLLKEAYDVQTLEKGNPSYTSTLEQLDNSPELRAHVKETLRLGAPFLFTEIRKVMKNAKIGPLKLRKGDMVLASLLLNQFKEDDFPDAFKFDRTRHYKGNSKYPRNNFSPFGFGFRSCIGKYMARMNMKIIFLKMIEHFKIEYLENNPKFSNVNEALPFHVLETVDLRLSLRK